MITGYFGVPGAGKTTLLTKKAMKALKVKNSNLPLFVLNLLKKRKYNHIYTNFYCEGCEKIDFKDLGNFKIYDSLIILDELAMDADNRKFKEFSTDIRDFFILHRHLGNDIVYATQSYEAVDLKIRFLTQELWYMSKSVVPFCNQFTVCRRIYRNININEHTSELTMGYRFCNFLEALFVSNVQIVFRKRYYSKFNSFDEGQLAHRRQFHSVEWQHPDDFPVNILPDDDKVA